MRRLAVILSTLAFAAALAPAAALAAAEDVPLSNMTVSVVRSADDKPLAATRFDPHFVVTGEDKKHVTFRWIASFNCGKGIPGDFLDPADPNTPSTFTWGHASCTGPLAAAVQVVAYYDGQPFAACEYQGGPADGEEAQCTPIDATTTESVQAIPGGKAPQATAPAQPRTPFAPGPPHGGLGDVPIAVIGSCTLLLAVYGGYRLRKRSKPAKKK